MTRKKATKHIGFKKLSNEVTAEYRKKGYSAKRARAIGNDTAGKVAAKKRRKRK